MEIQLKTNVDPIGRLPGSQAKKVEVQAQTGGAVFNHSEGLNQVLQQTADVRPGKVAQAQEVVGISEYPPKETIQKIAKLLAANIGQDKSNTPEI